jgi:hypothetical protein
MIRNWVRFAFCIGALSLLGLLGGARAATLQPIADVSGVISSQNGTEYFNGWVVSYNGYVYARCSYQNTANGVTMLVGGCFYATTADSVTFYGETYFQNQWCPFTYEFQKNSAGAVSVSLTVRNPSGSLLLNRSGVLDSGSSFWTAG